MTARSNRSVWRTVVALVLAWGAAASAPTGARAAEPIRVRGMTFVSGESGERHLVVRAERAEVDPASEIARLTGVTVHVAGTAVDGGGELSLRCDSARVALEGDAFRLDGDVRGRDADGRTFRTAWLEFDGEAGVLRTDAPVTVVDGTTEYRGGALVYDLEARDLKLTRGVRVVRGSP